MNPSDVYKGFTLAHLHGAFGVTREEDGTVVVPYRERDGRLYREKAFTPQGNTYWRGDALPQMPYGLESLALGGEVLLWAEGESDAWALRTSFPTTPVLGLPGASSWRPEWAELARPFPVVYLSFDGDDAGRSLTDAVWPDMPWARRVRLSGSDTREVLQLRGEEAYEALLDDADYGAALWADFARHLPTSEGIAA